MAVGRRMNAGIIAALIAMALVVVALLLLYCLRRRRQRPAVTESAGEKEPLIQPEKREEVKSRPSPRAKTPEKNEEVEEEQSIVSEEMVKATRKKIMFAQTERTQSLYEMFEKQDVQDIANELNSLDEVSALINQAGVERCNLIFGIDYTGSNYLQGKKTFGGKCLHNISDKIMNPYQNVISYLGETLEPFHSDDAIPAFGFGDAYTKDHSVFSLKENGMPNGFQEVLSIYNQLTPKVRLGGPTNFAPLIRKAIEIVKTTRCYHILVIVADGQVTNEKATTEAIVEASNYPLSIITVGVGDGPWETMHDFDDKLPVRNFDNFHFVDYAKVTENADNPSTAFAIHALMEIPEQYKTMKKLQLLYE